MGTALERFCPRGRSQLARCPSYSCRLLGCFYKKLGRKLRPGIEQFDADDAAFRVIIKYDVWGDFGTLQDLSGDKRI